MASSYNMDISQELGNKPLSPLAEVISNHTLRNVNPVCSCGWELPDSEFNEYTTSLQQFEKTYGGIDSWLKMVGWPIWRERAHAQHVESVIIDYMPGG